MMSVSVRHWVFHSCHLPHLPNHPWILAFPPALLSLPWGPSQPFVLRLLVCFAWKEIDSLDDSFLLTGYELNAYGLSRVLHRESLTHHSSPSKGSSRTWSTMTPHSRISFKKHKWLDDGRTPGDRVFSATCVPLVRSVVPAAVPKVDRWRYVTKRDLVKYGYTDEYHLSTQLVSGMHERTHWRAHGRWRVTSRAGVEIEKEISCPEAREEGGVLTVIEHVCRSARSQQIENRENWATHQSYAKTLRSSRRFQFLGEAMSYLGQSYLGQSYLGQAYLGQFYLGQTYLGQANEGLVLWCICVCVFVLCVLCVLCVRVRVCVLCVCVFVLCVVCVVVVCVCLRSCRWQRVVRQRLQASHVELGRQNERWEMSFKIGVSRDQRRPETKTNNLDQKMCFHPCRRRKVWKCFCQQWWQDTMMETTLTDHSRWPRGMCRMRTSTVQLAGGFRRTWASWPIFAEACTEPVMQHQSGETHGQKCGKILHGKKELKIWIGQSKLMCRMMKWRWILTRNLLRKHWRVCSWNVRKSFATCHEKWRANSTDRQFQEIHVDFKFGCEVGVCCSSTGACGL